MRHFRFIVGCMALAIACCRPGTSLRAADAELSYRVELAAILTGPEKYYFTQSRGAIVPGESGLILVTSQEAERVGSHGYHDVFQIESRDHGKTWTEAKRIESLRRQKLASGDDFVIGDICPQ